MKIVNKSEFLEISKEGYTLVDFFANWCGPCKMLTPVLDELSNEMDNVKFVKVDVDQEGELAAEYKVMSIPAIFMLKDGQVIAQTGGYQPKDAMKNFIENAINK